MNFVKKLIFAPLFLIVFALLIYQLNFLLVSYDLIFSLSTATLIQLITISVLFSASCLSFVLFVTLASEWKIILPVGIIASAVPLIFIPSSLALIFNVAIFISFLLISLDLDSILKTYLNFQPSAILGPSIRHLSTLLILSFCLIYFFSVSKTITQDGFQIPDSLINTALKMSPQTPSAQTEQVSLAPNLANDLIKQTIKDQMQNFIKPYLNFIPAGLAILLFFTLQSMVSIINLLIYPLLWITFSILKSTGFVKFEIEQRPVKKLIV